MRIGIDCRQFYDVHTNRGAGVERFTYHLVKNLLAADQVNEYVLFFQSQISPETVYKVKSRNDKVAIVKILNIQNKIPLWHRHWHFSRLLKKENLDLAIFPSGSAPLFYSRPSILVVHDLAIYQHPDWFPEKQWFSTKVVVPRSIKKARTIVAVSQSTKKDLIDVFKVPQDKIKVIYPGIVIKSAYLPEEVDKVLRKFAIKSQYIFFVGTIEPRKNLMNLVKAFSNFLFDNEDSQVSLILAGIKGWKFYPIFQNLNDVNKRLLGSQIKYVGKISNRERNILIKNCRAFVFPSLYEGFGFPILEAMALGVPVLTSNNSSLKEIGENAALLVDPADVSSIRRGIKQILDDIYLRQTLIKNGRTRAAKFNWPEAIRQFQTLLK